MPTILRKGGFVVKLYGPPREHPPPHVHVEHGPAELVVIRLRTKDSSQRIWRAYGMKDSDIVTAYRLVEAHHGRILRAWRKLHGDAQGQ